MKRKKNDMRDDVYIHSIWNGENGGREV